MYPVLTCDDDRVAVGDPSLINQNVYVNNTLEDLFVRKLQGDDVRESDALWEVPSSVQLRFSSRRLHRRIKKRRSRKKNNAPDTSMKVIATDSVQKKDNTSTQPSAMNPTKSAAMITQRLIHSSLAKTELNRAENRMQ